MHVLLGSILQPFLDIVLRLKIKSHLIQNKKHDSMYVDSEGLAWPYNSLVPPHETADEIIEERRLREKNNNKL